MGFFGRKKDLGVELESKLDAMKTEHGQSFWNWELPIFPDKNIKFLENLLKLGRKIRADPSKAKKFQL